MCGGKDRFRFDDLNGCGTFFCNKCGGGNGFELVKLKFGIDFMEALKTIEPILWTARVRKPMTSNRSWGDELRRLWLDSFPVFDDEPVGRYLFKRCGLRFPYPPALRYIPRLRYYDASDDLRFFPAMLACVSDVNGKGCAIQCTYLTDDGEKAPVGAVRKTMGNIPPGSAIRLGKLVGDAIGIAEGLETAISAAALHGGVVWSVLSANGMRKWQSPDGVKSVTIFSDNDENYTGQAAAYVLANDLVIKIGIGAKVIVPDVVGDWNDVWRDR